MGSSAVAVIIEIIDNSWSWNPPTSGKAENI